MPEIIIKQMPSFKRNYKKLHKEHKAAVNDAIMAIVKNPFVGEEKKGDLLGVWVYKFKLLHQEFLLAYEWDNLSRVLIALGVHENFYRDLKRN